MIFIVAYFTDSTSDLLLCPYTEWKSFQWSPPNCFRLFGHVYSSGVNLGNFNIDILETPEYVANNNKKGFDVYYK